MNTIHEITGLFKPINERIRVQNKLQIWAAKHAYTLIFLSLFGIVAWLVILTVAVINTYV